MVMERVDEYLAMEDDIFTVNNYYIDTVSKLKAAIADKQYTMVNNPNPTRKKDTTQTHQHHKQSSDSTSQIKSSGGSLFSGWMSNDASSLPSATDLSSSNKYAVIRINDLTVM